MKIGIDCRLWNETGVGRYIRNLVWELSRLDKKNEYVLFFRKEEFEKVLPPGENFQKRLADIRWHSAKEQASYVPLLRRENLDLVHFPYYSLPVFYNRPFVVTIHDLIPLHRKTGQASTLPSPLYRAKLLAFKFVVSKAARSARRIIAPSIASKNDIVNYFKIDPKKVSVIYEGVDESLKNKDSDKSDLLLYVGNAYPHKNLETLLFSFKKAREDNTKMELILVGKEDYFYKRLKHKAIKLNLGKGVKFYGFAKDSDLASLYKKAKAIVIPSFIEGFGLPALEGMANKAIILASDIPSLHEVGGDAAIYFDPRNEDDLTKKIKDLFNGKYQDRVDRGLQRVREFSWRKTAEQTLKIYESSIGLRQG